MIITERLAPYVVYYEDSIQAALQKINNNTRRLVFCLSEFGVLEGLVTDGDFRRWVVQVDNIDLTRPVREIANRQFVRARSDDSPLHIESLLSAKITAVPLVDALGRLSSIAWAGAPSLRIGHWELRDDKPAFLIAEIGNNHNGSLALAKRLIEAAAEAGANCAKFQLRDMGSLYANGGRSISEDLGTEYTLDLLERFQLSTDEMFEALDHVRDCGLIPLCTPWDLPSLERLVQYDVEALKIASADLTNHPLLLAAARTRKPLLISTGMSLEHEINEAVQLLRAEAAQFVLLQCNSTYPVPMRDINLAYMDRLKEISQGPVGYSGHELGYEVCIAAVARGAKVIEKHFTLDRNLEGNDHRVSLLPDEFGSMVKAIRNVEDAIGTCDTRALTQGERLNREVLAKSLIAARDILQGEVLSASMIAVRSPGRGLQPSRLPELLGLPASRDIKAGEVFFESDIHGSSIGPRTYGFDRPWGIPVRYHDYRALTENCAPDFVEIHMSYRDLELDPAAYFEAPSGAGLVVHAPELFAGDHVLDLSAADVAYRKRSIQELQRVIDRTRQLKRHFPSTARPFIIVNAGGFTLDRFLPADARNALYERVSAALAELDQEGVELILQTMPPFPWHFGGQRFHNLFMDPVEIAEFCSTHGYRICFDSSHSKLACNYFGWSMRDFVRQVGAHIAHLHLVDARGHHDEGLQIGAGEIDFGALCEDLRSLAPGVSFIPEIWQGHKNGGEGFWLALDRLEAHLARNPDATERV